MTRALSNLAYRRAKSDGRREGIEAAAKWHLDLEQGYRVRARDELDGEHARYLRQQATLHALCARDIRALATAPRDARAIALEDVLSAVGAMCDATSQTWLGLQARLKEALRAYGETDA